MVEWTYIDLLTLPDNKYLSLDHRSTLGFLSTKSTIRRIKSFAMSEYLNDTHKSDYFAGY